MINETEVTKNKKYSLPDFDFRLPLVLLGLGHVLDVVVDLSHHVLVAQLEPV
jgi:hypothetical protein